ncbi:hypothetical protein BC835DRAFT_1396075 [Cytidiella melzeri]|nr:hypothetical protein BC835DRAFT_1396075 [Cytidiella melzeri]
MSTPAASTKSLSSTQPEAQNATSNKVAPPQNDAMNVDQQQQPVQEGNPSGLDQEGYPPQKHTGQVGLGPEYASQREATGTDKITGLKDEIVGKITRNQDKVQHGHEQRTGELKKKKFEEDGKADPFSGAKEEKKDEPASAATKTGGDEPGAAGDAPPTGVTGKRGRDGVHPSEAGAQEQAATTAPEGTAEAEKQRQGGNTDGDKQIDESSNKKLRSE